MRLKVGGNEGDEATGMGGMMEGNGGRWKEVWRREGGKEREGGGILMINVVEEGE